MVDVFLDDDESEVDVLNDICSKEAFVARRKDAKFECIVSEDTLNFFLQLEVRGGLTAAEQEKKEAEKERKRAEKKRDRLAAAEEKVRKAADEVAAEVERKVLEAAEQAAKVYKNEPDYYRELALLKFKESARKSFEQGWGRKRKETLEAKRRKLQEKIEDLEMQLRGKGNEGEQSQHPTGATGEELDVFQTASRLIRSACASLANQFKMV